MKRWKKNYHHLNTQKNWTFKSRKQTVCVIIYSIVNDLLKIQLTHENDWIC